MHEVGIAQEAVEVAIEHASAAGASRILLVRLRIGALSGVVPEALAFAFDAVTQGTMAEGAKLEIENVAVVCHCEGCDEDFEPQGYVYDCPKCGKLSWDVLAGRELDVVHVEGE